MLGVVAFNWKVLVNEEPETRVVGSVLRYNEGLCRHLKRWAVGGSGMSYEQSRRQPVSLNLMYISVCPSLRLGGYETRGELTYGLSPALTLTHTSDP